MPNYSGIFPDIEEKMYGPGALEAQLTLSAQENPFSIPYMLAARIRGQRARGDYFDDLSALTNQRAQKTMQLNEADLRNKLMEDFFTKRASTQMAAENLGLPFNRPDIVEKSNIDLRGQEADVLSKLATATKTLEEAGYSLDPNAGVPFQDLGFGGLNPAVPLGVREKQAGADNPNMLKVKRNFFTKEGDAGATTTEQKMTPEQFQQFLAAEEARRRAQMKGDKDTLATTPGAGGGRQPAPIGDPSQQQLPANAYDNAPPAAPPEGNSDEDIERDGLILNLRMITPEARQNIEKTLNQIGGKLVNRGVRTNAGVIVVYIDTPKGRQRLTFDFNTGQLKQ